MKFAYYNHVLIGVAVVLLAAAVYWLFMRGGSPQPDDYDKPPTVCAACGHSWQMDAAEQRRRAFEGRHREASSTPPDKASASATTPSVAAAPSTESCPACGQSLVAYESVFCPKTQRRFVVARIKETPDPIPEETVRKLSPFIDHPKTP